MGRSSSDERVRFSGTGSDSSSRPLFWIGRLMLVVVGSERSLEFLVLGSSAVRLLVVGYGRRPKRDGGDDDASGGWLWSVACWVEDSETAVLLVTAPEVLLDKVVEVPSSPSSYL